jgi:hypothetical protein
MEPTQKKQHKFYHSIYTSCVLKYKQDGVLDQNRTMDNAQKHNICTMYHRHKLLDLILKLSWIIGESAILESSKVKVKLSLCLTN